MENITQGQDKQLNKIATIFADETSKKKGYFPKDRKFSNKDKITLAKNIKIVGPTIASVLKTPKVIKKHDTQKEYKKHITKEEYNRLDTYIKETLKMDSWGVCEFNSNEIFKGKGIPYKNVIVMSKIMDKSKFNLNELPSLNCQLEVMKIYGDTGIAALKVTDFLRELDYGAVPNHSLGGNIDYTRAGLKANLGFIGKHGLLITKENGPCNRLSIVYTSIENLSEFLNNDIDYSWGQKFCSKCKLCVITCPQDAIYEENKTDDKGHIESICNEKCNAGFKEYGCAKCIACCPFTKVGYENLHSSYIKTKEKENNAN